MDQIWNETPITFVQYLDTLERELLMLALENTKQNHSEAARRLGLTYRVFRYRATRLGIKENSKLPKRRELGKHWPKLRMDALRKYGNSCQCCGASPRFGARLEVDHVKPRHLYPELEFDLNNLQVLCSSCHGAKGAISETDWRISV